MFRLGPVYRGQFGLWRGLIFFTTDRPHYILKCPHFPGTITAEWFWLCIRSQCHHMSCMLCAHLMKTAVRYQLRAQGRSFVPTQQVWWDHREKSRRASTLWDCQGKSHLTGLPPANGIQSERGVYSCIHIHCTHRQIHTHSLDTFS